MQSFRETLYLNIYESHLSLITNFSGYAGKFKCSTCEKCFKGARNVYRHQETFVQGYPVTLAGVEVPTLSPIIDLNTCMKNISEIVAKGIVPHE